jgi:molybdenum cofactor synthesis domain-containing protein
MIRAAVITLSDKGSRGEREDESGPALRELLGSAGVSIVRSAVLPDDRSRIAALLAELADSGTVDLIVTTGGTGVAPRDVTPEATRDVIERELPGMAEAMRAESLRKTPNAMLSRAVAGIRGRVLIINLPGSPRGARENLSVILPALAHAVAKTQGDPSDCASRS